MWQGSHIAAKRRLLNDRRRVDLRTIYPPATSRNMYGGVNTMWNQVYNPLGNAALSTLAAALPVVTLLALIASGKVKAPIAAIVALLVAIGVAVYIFTMPANLAIRASVLGAVIGFFPIG